MQYSIISNNFTNLNCFFKAGDFPDTPNLMPSILAVFKITKTTALLNKLETVQTLCFEILLSYPNEVLIEIATLHPSEVIEVLNLYCHLQIPPEIRMLVSIFFICSLVFCYDLSLSMDKQNDLVGHSSNYVSLLTLFSDYNWQGKV